MKIIDDRGKLFGKINIIDLLVLFVIVLAGLMLAGRLLPGEEGKDAMAGAGEEMEFTVKVEEVSIYTVEAARTGDRVYDYDTGSNIGAISDVSYSPHMQYVVNMDNEAVAIESLDKYDLFITIRADFAETEQALTVGEMIVAVGRKVLVYNKYLFVEGQIYSRESGLDE